jgi:Fe-S-cluster containining protein
MIPRIPRAGKAMIVAVGASRPVVDRDRDVARSKNAWYAEGLEFTCTRCGNCCTGEPGFVWVTPEEIERLAALVGVALDEFARRYVRRVADHLSLIERANGECIFWDAHEGCTVYPERPAQCRTWPFWPPHLESRRSWEKLQAFCPGSRQGRLYAIEEIETQARQAAAALRLRTR